MARAYDQCSANGYDATWIQEQQVMNLSPTKTDVFVLEEFEGPVFKHLAKGDKIKCTVLGPLALSACFYNNTPVPNLPYPMYTLAMMGVIITCSNIEKSERDKLQNLIQSMAGVFSADFHDGITHVVAGSVTTDKYRVAVETDTPVMTKEWVYKVWETSKKEIVSAIDPRFLQFKFPALYGLRVSVSGLNKVDKMILKKKVEAHGGVYLPELHMDTTDLLICISDDSAKYTHAVKWKIPCVKPDYIFDSTDKGYALPFENYKVAKSNKASTPTKDSSNVDNLGDISMCSTILNPNDSAVNSRVDDTINSTTVGTLAPVIQGKTTKDWLLELDLARVKKAGHFLDGLRIYLSGFTEPDQVQMTRVFKFAGATRLTQLVDSVTHVVHAVGKAVEPDTAKITRELGISPHSVTLEWIVESMKRGTKVSEEDYMFPPPVQAEETIIAQPEKVSRAIFDQPPASSPDKTGFDILQQYKQPSSFNKPDVSVAKSKSGGGSVSRVEESTMPDNSTQIDPFFADLKFELAGLPENTEQELTEWITEVGGEVMFSDYQGVVDYLITPVEGGHGKLKYKEHLTNYWIDDCLDAAEMLPKQYYHYPVKIIPDSAPLKGSVTCVSGYSGKERNFISTVIALLGGNPQDMFAKKDNKDKGVVASTHLVCNAPEGPKYKAALNWGIPVIHKDWMRACLKEWKWISEQPFLIGDSKSFSKDKPLPSVPLDDEAPPGDDTTAGENTLVDNQEDGELEEKENTVLQDMDQNRSTRSALSRRSSKSNIVDKANISTSKSRRDSNAADTDKPETADVKTPVQSSSAAKRLSVHQDDNNPKTPALTPGMERLRAPLVDMYSPLPSQPWPDSQQDCATPINHRQSRASMAAAGSGMKRKRGPDDDGLADMPTPKTPYGEHLGADPSPDTRKFFKRRRDETLKFAEVFSMDEAEMAKQKRRQAEWLKKTSAKPNQGIDESLTEETNTNKLESKESLDAKMRENYKKKGQNWDDIGADFTRKQSEPSDEESKCLAGCVVMIAKKISQMNKELESIVEELGGEISHHLDEATTHYVFQGKQREATKEFKQAKEMGKIIVAPEWIYMCRSEERKVGEAAFPYTYNPSKLVNQSTMHKTALNDAGSAASNKTKSRLTKAKLPQPDFQENEETKLDDEEMENDHENNETLAADTTVPMDTNNQSTIPGSATKLAESGYKKSFKELQSLAESLKNSPALSIVSSVKKQKQNNKADTSLTDTTPLTTPQKPIVADEKEKESQVIWLDPEEQKNKEAMALKLSMETPDLGSINFSENMTAAFDASMDNNSAANKIFTITSGIDESKAREIVESLGSVLDIEIGPDNLPTHVIVGKVSRSEKMLLCIASGRWILHASYLEESKKAGRWLQEENYELGNPDNTFLDLTENTTECKMSIAARKRRLEASRPGARPVFADLITYLALPSHKQGPFLRLIKAGGGTVVDELTSENMRTLTHVITENKYYSLIEGKSSQLCELSIPIIAPIYLNDYLINEALPLVENYLAENYKPKWEESKRTRGRNSSLSSDTTTSGRRKRRTNS